MNVAVVSTVLTLPKVTVPGPFTLLHVQLTPAGGSTKVDWSMEGENAYPLGRYMGLLMDGMIGADLVQGLENLKTYIEGMEK